MNREKEGGRMKDVSLMTRIIIGGVIVLLLLAVMILPVRRQGSKQRTN